MVARASSMAETMLSGSLLTSVRSAAPMAASVPAPIAMPRSAWASAAASFTPSPTKATATPPACSRRMTSTFPSGLTPANTSAAGMPSWPATASAARGLSPVSRTGRRPRPRTQATAHQRAA